MGGWIDALCDEALGVSRERAGLCKANGRIAAEPVIALPVVEPVTEDPGGDPIGPDVQVKAITISVSPRHELVLGGQGGDGAGAELAWHMLSEKGLRWGKPQIGPNSGPNKSAGKG